MFCCGTNLRDECHDMSYFDWWAVVVHAIYFWPIYPQCNAVWMFSMYRSCVLVCVFVCVCLWHAILVLPKICDNLRWYWTWQLSVRRLVFYLQERPVFISWTSVLVANWGSELDILTEKGSIPLLHENYFSFMICNLTASNVFSMNILTLYTQASENQWCFLL